MNEREVPSVRKTLSDGNTVTVIYYDRTNRAEEILRDGFRDYQGSYGFDTILCGVFISDVSLDENEGAKGEELLEITLDCDISEYQLTYEGANYREWCVPAELLNGKVSEWASRFACRSTTFRGAIID